MPRGEFQFLKFEAEKYTYSMNSKQLQKIKRSGNNRFRLLKKISKKERRQILAPGIKSNGKGNKRTLR